MGVPADRYEYHRALSEKIDRLREANARLLADSQALAAAADELMMEVADLDAPSDEKNGVLLKNLAFAGATSILKIASLHLQQYMVVYGFLKVEIDGLAPKPKIPNSSDEA